MAVTMAALCLYDGDAEISADNINALLEGANVTVAHFFLLACSLLRYDASLHSVDEENRGFYLAALSIPLLCYAARSLTHAGFINTTLSLSRILHLMPVSKQSLPHPPQGCVSPIPYP
jgi:hypothetical protein